MRILLCFLVSLIFLSGVFGQSISPTGPINLCPGGSQLLTVNAVPGGTTFQWQLNATNIGGAITSTHLATTAGSYTVIINTPGPSGIDTLGPVLVIMNANPNANFNSTPSNQCSNIVVSFTNISVGALTYLWNFGDINSLSNNTSTLINPTHQFIGTAGNTNQNFQVTLIATSSAGCKDTIVHTVTTKQIPNGVLIDPINNFRFCGNAGNATLTVYDASTPTNNTNYNINWGNGNPNYNSSTAPSGISQVYPTGIYTITYTVTGSNGCVDVSNYNVYNITNPQIGAGIPANTQGCGPITVCFPINNFSNNHPSTIYTVYFGDGATQTFNHPPPDSVCHTYTTTSCGAANNSFTFKIQAKNGCDSSIGLFSPVRVYTKPVAQFTLNPNPGCINSQINFINTTIEGSNNSCSTSTIYTWNYGDGSPVVTVFNNSTQIHTYSTAGTYTITLTAQNSCGTSSFSNNVCIQAPQLPSFTASPINGCNPLVVNLTNTSTALPTCGSITRLWTVTKNGSTCIADSTNNFVFTSGTNSGSLNPVIQFNNQGTYTVTLSLTNNCGTFSSSPITITVKRKPQVNLTALVSICQGQSISPTSTLLSCAGTISAYSWSFPGGTPNTSNQQNPGTITYPTNGNYTISLTVTNECGSTTATTPLTVNALPFVTAVTNQTVCNGSLSSAITFSGNATSYTWTNNNTSIGLPASGTGNIAPFVASNPGSSPVTATITVTPHSSLCNGNSVIFTITVNPAAAVQFSSPNQTICSGGQTTAVILSSSTAGASITWTSIQPVGITGVTLSGTTTIPVQTLFNSTSAPITVNYIATATTTGGTNCPGASFTYSIVVNPIATVTQPSGLVVCNASSTSVITFTGSVSGTTYSWTNNNASIGLAASGTGNIPVFTAINATTTIITATITVTPTFSNGGVSCTGLPKTFTITVNPTPTVTQPSNQVLCHGSPTSAIIFSSSVTGTNYTWTNSNTSIGLPANGIGNIVSFIATNISNTPVTTTITVTPNYSNGGVTCVGPQKTFTITVNPIASVTQPGNISVCNGSPTSAINFSGPVTGTTYSWTNDNTSIGLIASGSGNIPVFTATNASVTPITANITVTPNYSNAGVSCQGLPKTFVITVNPTASVTQPANQVVCNGSLTTLVTIGGSLVTGTTYSWTNNNTSIGLAANGTGNILSFNATNSSSSPVIATITITPSANGCNGIAVNFSITVNPAASVQFSSPNQTICSGGQTTAINLSSTTSGVNISWICTPPVGITGAITSGTTGIPIQTLSNSTNTALIVDYIATATTTGGAACPGSSSNYSITVNPTPNVTATPNSQTICSNTVTNILLTSTVSGTIFNWTVNSNPNITGASNASGNAITQSLVNTGIAIQIVTYTITPSYSNNGVICQGNPINVSVTVNPNPLITNTPLTQTICSAASTTAVTLNSNVTGTTFAWTASATAGVTGYTNTGTNTIPSETITNTNTIAGVVTYVITATANGCSGTPVNYSINVNPKPSVTNTPLLQTTCSGSSTTLVTFTSNVSGATFTWTASAIGGLTGFLPSGNNTIPVQTISNPTAAAGTVTYVITPSINGCPGDLANYIITVNPAPAVQFSSPDQTICSGSPSSVVNLSTPTTGANISWTCNPPVGISGVIPSGTTNIPVQTLINNTSAPINVNYIVSATTTGSATCPGASSIYTIIVNPAPVVQFSSPDQTICSGTQSSVINLSSTTAGVNVNWTCSPPIGITGTLPGGTTNIPAQTLINNTSAPIIVNYIASATTTGSATCPGATSTYSITVNPIPSVTATPSSETICSNSATNISLSSSVSGTSFSWTFTTSGSVSGGSNGSGSTISQTLVNSSTNPQTVTYQITPAFTNNGVICNGTQISVVITVNPSASISNNPVSQTLCTGNNTTPLTWTSLSSVSSYSWIATSSAGITGFVSSGTGNLPSMPLTNNTNIQASLIYSVTSSVNVCPGAPSDYTIIVNPNAIADFTPTDTIKCPPFNITNTIVGLQTFPANNSQYEWYVNGSLFFTGAVFPGYTFLNEDDSVTIKLKAISLFGCKADSMSRKFYTYKLPHPAFTLSDTVGCGPLTLQILNTSSNPSLFTYTWDFGNGQTSTLEQPGAITFLTNPNYGDTTYIVSLKVFSICDTITITKTVRVKSKPKALFTPSRTVGCSPMTVVFSNTSKGVNNTYYWDFGDGTTTITYNLNAVSHTYNTGIQDTFYIKLKAVNECGSDSITYSVIVAPNNISLNLAVNGTNYYGCAPHTVAFINNTTGASSFNWNFGDGNTLNTTANVDTVYHTYLISGTFPVVLTAQNSCTDTSKTILITVFPKPHAAFIADRYTACIGDAIHFTNQSDSATSYLWQFGDGGTSTLLNPTHSYTTPGLYTVTLIIYRVNAPGNVCTDSINQQVQIVASLPGWFSMSDTSGMCAPFTVTFVNQNRPSVTTAWNFGDGNTGSGDSVIHTYAIAGIYTVKLTVTVPGGCTYITQRIVTVSGPSGSLQYTGGYKCYPDPVRLEATAVNSNLLLWNFGDGNTLSTTQLIIYHNYDNPGIYIPTLTLQNSAGCNYFIQGADTIKVDKIDAGYTFTQQQACGSTNLSFTDTSHVFFGKALVKWDFGDGNIGTGVNVNHTYSITGSYTIRMIIIGNSGCSDTVTKQLNIFVKNIPVASIAADIIGCTNQPVLFSGIVQSTDAINISQWTISNGNSSSGQNLSYIFTLPGVYNIRLIVGTVNGCYDTAYHNIQINPSPIVTANAALRICLGNSVQLNATGAAQYQWSPLQGLSCSNCANPIATPVISTPYVVTGTNNFGCPGYDTVPVTVIQPLNMVTSGNDTLCIGKSVNLLASGAASYIWTPSQGLNSNTISNPTASPVVTTSYRVVGYDGFNCFTDTAFIIVAVGQYPIVSLGPDKVLSTGTIFPLASTIQNGPIRNWNWTPLNDLSCSNCALPEAYIKNDISYVVEVTNIYGCKGSDTIKIKVFCTDSQVFIPNAFSPDGDGINDMLMVMGKGIVTVKSFRIFNRWGEVVFEKSNFPPNNPAYGWNGKIKGIVGPPDVFVYTSEVICENGTPYTFKGNVSIIK